MCIGVHVHYDRFMYYSCFLATFFACLALIFQGNVMYGRTYFQECMCPHMPAGALQHIGSMVINLTASHIICMHVCKQHLHTVMYESSDLVAAKVNYTSSSNKIVAKPMEPDRHVWALHVHNYYAFVRIC